MAVYQGRPNTYAAAGSARHPYLWASRLLDNIPHIRSVSAIRPRAVISSYERSAWPPSVLLGHHDEIRLSQSGKTEQNASALSLVALNVKGDSWRPQCSSASVMLNVIFNRDGEAAEPSSSPCYDRCNRITVFRCFFLAHNRGVAVTTLASDSCIVISVSFSVSVASVKSVPRR